MKLVIDTNLLVSGSLWDGSPALLLDAVGRGEATLITSSELLAELADVLSRSKFVPRILAKSTTAEELSRKLADKAAIVAPVSLPTSPGLRDPKDLPVLACAVAASADAIVSGDDDLLALQSFQGIPIIAAVEALRRLALPSV